MNKRVKTFLTVAVLLLTTSNAFSAEYIVQPGDELRFVAERLGHTMNELQAMNAICNPDNIYAGQTLVYVSDKDIKNAINWCLKMLSNFHPSDNDYRYYWGAAEDLQDAWICYDLDDGKEVHYSTVLLYANQWREYSEK